MMKKLFFVSLLAVFAIQGHAQDFEVPKNYSFKTQADYDSYEAEVLKGIEWLLNTPIKTQPQKRIEANAFILQWLTGTKTVSITIKSEIVTFMEPNNDLLMIFMCGWARHVLQTGDNKNNLAGNLKGVEAVMDFYTKNKDDLRKDKNVEKYLKMKNEGTLEAYIARNAN